MWHLNRVKSLFSNENKDMKRQKVLGFAYEVMILVIFSKSMT